MSDPMAGARDHGDRTVGINLPQDGDALGHVVHRDDVRLAPDRIQRQRVAAKTVAEMGPRRDRPAVEACGRSVGSLDRDRLDVDKICVGRISVARLWR